MINSSYAPFSMMGGDRKAKIDKAVDQSLSVMEKILNAPEAAKDNLMLTDYKVAASTLSFVGKLLQAESGMLQAITVVADRADKSEDFKKMISGHLPMFHLPEGKKKA